MGEKIQSAFLLYRTLDDSDSQGQKRTMVGGFESGREGCRLDD